MAAKNSLLLAIWLLAGASLWSQSGLEGMPTTKTSQYGTISGQITDGHGKAQAGVPIIITRQDGLISQKTYSGVNGRFVLSRLLPGLYAVEVSLPNFLPFSKAPVSVRPGAQVLVDVSLRALAESIEIGLPQDPAGAREDWKWTLRTAAPIRPILRFQPEPDWNPTQPPDAITPSERPLKGTVLVSAGNEARGFGADPGLRTIFDMQYDWTGSSALDLAGSAGWERSTPAASFRAAWNRNSDNGSHSSFSATVRQLFLPDAYRHEFSTPDMSLGQRIQSVSGGYENEMFLSEHLSLRYGAFFDSLSLGRRMSQWSPFGQLTYTSSDQNRWSVGYTSEAPRLLPSGPGTGPAQLERLLAIPQVSEDDLQHPAMEGGKHFEGTWERKLGIRYRFQAAGFYDSLSNAAVSLSAANGIGFPVMLLRDPFSDAYFLNGGSYSSIGARAALGTRLSKNSELMLGYSYSGGLQAVSNDLTAENSQALRDILRAEREHSFVVKLRSTLPRTHTQLVTSYRWLPHNAVVPGDPYNAGLGRSAPYLNVAVVQPLPSSNIIPGQFQAIADFNNLLAQGYVPANGPEGASCSFFPSARSFRGGFSFVF